MLIFMLIHKTKNQLENKPIATFLFRMPTTTSRIYEGYRQNNFLGKDQEY